MSPPLCLHTTVASLSSLDGKLMTRSSRDRHMLVLHGQRRSPMAQTHVISYPPIICSWLLFSPVSRPRDWCGWLGRTGLRFAQEKPGGEKLLAKPVVQPPPEGVLKGLGDEIDELQQRKFKTRPGNQTTTCVGKVRTSWRNNMFKNN